MMKKKRERRGRKRRWWRCWKAVITRDRRGNKFINQMYFYQIMIQRDNFSTHLFSLHEGLNLIASPALLPSPPIHPFAAIHNLPMKCLSHNMDMICGRMVGNLWRIESDSIWAFASYKEEEEGRNWPGKVEMADDLFVSNTQRGRIIMCVVIWNNNAMRCNTYLHWMNDIITISWIDIRFSSLSLSRSEVQRVLFLVSIYCSSYLSFVLCEVAQSERDSELQKSKYNLIA